MSDLPIEITCETSHSGLTVVLTQDTDTLATLRAGVPIIVKLSIFSPLIDILMGSVKKSFSVISLISSHSLDFVFPDCEFKLCSRPLSLGNLRFSMKGIELDDLDTFDLSDPYFIIYSNQNELYRSEVIMDNLNPVWKDFSLKEKDIRDTIKINVWDKDQTADDFIGGCEIQKSEFFAGAIHVDIHNAKKKGNSKAGELLIHVQQKPDAISKIYSGLGIGVCFLIASCSENFSYSPIEYTRACFNSCEELWFGFGSSEASFWPIRDFTQDELLKRKAPGPCNVSACVINAFKEISMNKFWVFCIFLQRDVMDPKSFETIIKQTKNMPVTFKALVAADLNVPNLQSVEGLQVIRYSNNFYKENIKKQINGIVSDIESCDCL